MKFTLSWLKKYLDTTLTPQELGDHLTDVGLELDGLEDLSQTLKDFKVVQIKEATQHPDADRLKVCQVETGSGLVQVVCGGPNARAGLKTVLALPGMTIPKSGITLKTGKLRGVDSCGMLCSEEELGLPQEIPGTIIELPESTPIGVGVVEALNLNDPIFDIAITPNRGDCLGIVHIARDLAARGCGIFKPQGSSIVEGTFESSISISLSETPHYMGRSIRGVKNLVQPTEIAHQLQAIGVGVKTPLVDVTNYISYDMGHPLHVFDGDLIQGPLQIRFAKDGESFLGLDDKEYTLTPQDLIIADDSQVLALAGVMGGKTSGVTEATTNVFLESAWFDPILVAQTGRRHNILTDSRSRFERGVDPESTKTALEYATQLILELCGGEASRVVEAGAPKKISSVIDFSLDHVKRLGGIDLPTPKIQEILESLGCQVSSGSGNTLQVTTPSWRSDLGISEDLVEEVVRIYGCSNVPSVSLSVLPPKPLNEVTLRNNRMLELKKLLAGGGLKEVITWSFGSSKNAFGFKAKDQDPIEVKNPISQELSHMRTSLVPGLLEVLGKNQSRSIPDMGIFEVGTQFTDAHPAVLGIAMSGGVTQKTWSTAFKPVTVYDVKAHVQAVLEVSGLNPDSAQLYADQAPHWYHPGRSGTFKLGNRVLAHFGELHPATHKAFDLKGSCCVAEIYLDTFPPAKQLSKAPLSLSPYQSVERDFAFVVEKTQRAGDVLRAVRKADPKLIQEVQVFDVFESEALGPNHKSLALKVRIQPMDKTLSEEDLQTLTQSIITNVSKSTGGVLRQ